MDREAWRAAVHGVAKSRTRLSDGTDSVLPWAPPKRFAACLTLGRTHRAQPLPSRSWHRGRDDAQWAHTWLTWVPVLRDTSLPHSPAPGKSDDVPLMPHLTCSGPWAASRKCINSGSGRLITLLLWLVAFPASLVPEEVGQAPSQATWTHNTASIFSLRVYSRREAGAVCSCSASSWCWWTRGRKL